MATIFTVGYCTLIVKHLKRRESGLFYYRRGIPLSLRQYYQGAHEIKRSLRTRNKVDAITECQKLAALHTKQFDLLRSSVA